MSPRQRDLFQDDEQAELFGDDAPTPEYRADPDEVRQDLYTILAQARAAQTMPWDARRARLYRTIFPQMTNWLPEEVRRAAALRIRNGIGAARGGIASSQSRIIDGALGRGYLRALVRLECGEPAVAPAHANGDLIRVERLPLR
jgi:hypothetical protein